MNYLKKTISCILAVSLAIPSSVLTYADGMDDHTNRCFINDSPFNDNIACDPEYCPSYEENYTENSIPEADTVIPKEDYVGSWDLTRIVKKKKHTIVRTIHL